MDYVKAWWLATPPSGVMSRYPLFVETMYLQGITINDLPQLWDISSNPKTSTVTAEIQNDIFWASRIEGEKNMGIKMDEILHRMKAPCSHMYGSPTSVKMRWLQNLKRHFIWHHLKLQQHVAKVLTVSQSKLTSTSKSPTTNQTKINLSNHFHQVYPGHGFDTIFT